MRRNSTRIESEPRVGPDRSLAFASFVYRWRWGFSVAILGVLGVAFLAGVARVSSFSSAVAGLADTSNGDGAVKPLAFDPTMDIWFGEHDLAVRIYNEIENTFVPEDFVMVTFEENDHELGVFSSEALGAIARLTERFLTVPGVRHVRSLTYNPWIRWGTIRDEERSEEGLIISDLVEGDPGALDGDEVVTRMIATLGAERTAEKLGESRVREVLGSDADFSDHIGEPLLLGMILNEDATATVIQVQVLRPHIEAAKIERVFADEGARKVAPNLSSIEQQRAAIRGIEHFLRMEKGFAVATPEFAELSAWVEGLPEGDEKEAKRVSLADPTKNFMNDAEGELTRKYYEYDPVDGGYEDRSDSSQVVKAPSDFAPDPLSSYEFHLGGVPLFERNFERVGLADGKYVPMMFVVIMGALWIVFRRVSGVIVPILVVAGSVMGMLGVAFARGDLLNNLTMMSPNMLTAVGIADAIHLLAAWVLLRNKFDDKESLLIEVVRRNALPVFLTSLTTAVGFYSLTTSSIVPMTMLGTMAAFGTLCAWLLSMTLVPALLSLLPHRKTSKEPSRIERLFSEEKSRQFVDRVVGWRVPILAGAGLLTVVALFGLGRLTIDSDFRGMFPDDNPTMSDFNWIEGRMGGVGDLEVVFSGLGRDEFVELSVEEEERLSDLTLRSAGTTRDPTEFDPLSTEEESEFARLAAKQEAWNSSRIGVSTRFLESLEGFESRLREEMENPSSPLAVITDFVSPLDTLRKIHQVQNENRADFYRVPGEDDVPEEFRVPSLEYDEWTETWSLVPPQSGSSLVAQYYLQYESGARPGESLTTQLSSDRTQFRMQGRVLQASSVSHLEAFARIEEIARTEFPELVASAADSEGESSTAVSNFTLSGKTLLFARTSDLFAKGFMRSMGLALVVITILIAVMFRSFWLSVVSLIPNVLPIILPLSAFGLLGIPVDGPAVLVSSVALGVCVDDTIHFLTKFARGRKSGLSPSAALARAVAEAGAAMTVTTLVLILGFSTLLLSDFAPNFQMGALAAIMIGLAWVADFVVTTAVLSLDRRVAVGAASPSRSIKVPVTVGGVLLILASTFPAGAQNRSGVPIPEAPPFSSADAEDYGRQIAFYQDLYDRGWTDEVTQGTMTLFDSDGDSVRRSFSRMSLERAESGDKLITKFLSPAEIKGVTALTHENPGSSDDNWLYLPANKRVRRISGANNTASFQGTEFTYEDLATIDPREYKWRFLEEAELERGGRSEPVFKLHATPTYEDTGYSHVVLYIHRKHWRQERVEYFDKANRHLKTRDSRAWGLVHGRFWREKTIEMSNHQTGKRTVLEIPRRFLNLSLYKSKKTGEARKGLPEDLFTTRRIQG